MARSLLIALLLIPSSAAFAQTFAPATSIPAGVTNPVAIATKDLNGDGTLDLTITNGYVPPGSVSTLLGSGTGSFASATTLATGSVSAFSVAIGDFNRDGIPDVAVALAGGGAVSILLGTGGGAFAGFTTYSVGGSGFGPASIAIGDFNRDGIADLVTANQNHNSVSVLLGNGDGTFMPPSVYATGSMPFSVAVGDFNGDGIPDVVTANSGGNSVSILRGTASGALSAPASFTPFGGGVLMTVAVGDFNGDGKLDVAVARQSSVSIMLGNGSGALTPMASVAIASAAWGVAAADFDGDGKLDVVVTADKAYVLRGDGTGALAAPVGFTVGTTPKGVVIGDFNRDAIPDIATANENSATTSILLNTTPYFIAGMSWGDNRDGELGDGSAVTFTPTPVGVKNIGGLVAVAAGSQHAVAVKADGTVWTWGAGFNGGLGNGTFASTNLPVQVTGIDSAVSVAAGVQHTLAVMADSTVRAWGLNSLGQLGDGTATDHSTPVTVSGLSGVVAVAAGGGHSLALKADGTVWAFGRNDFGQLGDGTTIDRSAPVQVTGLSEIVAIGAGATDWHSLAVKADGTVWSWGRNNFGQLGDGTTTDRPTPAMVSGVSAVKSVAAGTGHSVAVKADGTVWTWGTNLHGQLGNGTTTDSFTPIQVPALGGVIAPSAGQSYTAVLKADGTVWSWGGNAFSGSLGDGTLVDRTSPVRVVNVTGVTALATGGQHSVVIAPAATIAMLAAMVLAMDTNPAVLSALSATLGAAQMSANAGKTTPACNQLGAFTRQVEAFRGGSLSPANADKLIDYAGRVRSSLGCR